MEVILRTQAFSIWGAKHKRGIIDSIEKNVEEHTFPKEKKEKNLPPQAKFDSGKNEEILKAISLLRTISRDKKKKV
jgi:hypothetical protein